MRLLFGLGRPILFGVTALVLDGRDVGSKLDDFEWLAVGV
jgi:hypothetical protein